MMISYLGWESVSIYAVLGARVISKAVMHVDFLELVLVRQRTSGHVYMVSGGVVHCEYHTVTRVANCAADLKAGNALLCSLKAFK